MARQFQGYARGRGFSSRNPGSAAVSRIQEQGNKTISGLRQQLQSKRQQDQQYIADLDSNFRRGEQIKDEIKSFEDKAFNLKMANVKRNQNQHLENIKTEAQNQADTYKQLAEFSQTLGQTALNVGTQIQKAQDEAASTVNKISGANRSTYADQAVAEELEKNDIANENKLAKVATENGLPEHTRQKQRAFSHNRQVKDKKAAVAEAWNQYSTRATYNNYGPDLAHKIFKELGLLDSNDRLFTEFANRYEKLNLAFKTTNSRTRAVNQSNELDTKATAQFFNNPTSETLFHAWQTHKAGTDDGRGPRNNKSATDYLFGTLLTNLNLSDEQVLDLLQNTNLRDENGNKLDDTFYSRFENTRVQKLLNDRRNSIVESVNDREKVVKAEQKDNYLKGLEAIESVEEGALTFDQFKEGINILDLNQQQRNLLIEKGWEQSREYPEVSQIIAQAEYMLSTGQDITPLLPNIKGPKKSFFVNAASQQKIAKTEAGIDDKAIRRTVKSALIKALGQQNVGDDKDPTLEIAIEDALIDIGKDTMINAPGSSLAQASSLALQQKLKEIQSGSGKYEVKGIGKGNDSSTGNYFSYYSVDGKYFTQVAKANSSEAIRAVRNRPDSRKDVFLVLTDDLATIYNAVQNNEGYQLPYALKELQKAYPDTVQLQLNKYADEFGKPRITVPLTYQQVLSARQEDTRAQRFMQQVETIQEERIIPIVADPSARSHPRFKTDAVNQRISFMQVAPADGGITGLTVQDYQELAYAVSAEAQRGTDDEFAVAASILNRLASGQYGSTVSEVIRAPGQYEAVYKGTARYEPELAQRLASPEGQRMIVAMLQKLQGRTDFKGQTQLGNRDASDPMFSDRGNFYHYPGQSAGSGAYQGPIDTSYERFIN